MRKILGVTGIRSEYDIMSTVFRAIERHPDLQLEVAVSGAHLSDAYGCTIRQIRADGFRIADEIESLLNADSASSRVKGLAIQLQGLVQTVTRLRPDVLLVLGDREEAMTTALVGAYMNLPVAHIAGGDRVVGNVDDQVRHAVTKLAHLHFTTNDESSERIRRMGEQEFRIHTVGNPGLDRLLSEPQLSDAELSARLGFELKAADPLIVVIQHVISTEIEDAYRQMRITLEALAELGLTSVLSYPNTDAGGQQMIRAIREFEQAPWLHAYKSMPRAEFVNVLRRAHCLVGNSSAGILEAPLLKLPVVNIGNRQKGRLHAQNVAFVPHDKVAIQEAVRRAVLDRAYREAVSRCANPYGDGHSAERIANILASARLDARLLIKDMTY
jgi:GDP/UDP-N,N'-diacetylbacillosamine 2-epimerase (hydrolysing)